MQVARPESHDQALFPGRDLRDSGVEMRFFSRISSGIFASRVLVSLVTGEFFSGILANSKSLA